MKARVIETGEIIEVTRLYPTIYSRLDANHKIAEEYNDDEIELIDMPKMVSIDRVWDWILRYFVCGCPLEFIKEMEKAFRKEMEE